MNNQVDMWNLIPLAYIKPRSDASRLEAKKPYSIVSQTCYFRKMLSNARATWINSGEVKPDIVCRSGSVMLNKA